MRRIPRTGKLTRRAACVSAAGLLRPLAAGASAAPGAGVSEILALDRASAIRRVRYDLTFEIPPAKTEPVRGLASIAFELNAPRAVVLDFGRPRERVREIRVGRKRVEAEFSEDHIILPAAATVAGDNSVAIEFQAGDESLNRNEEFLYTLFVPARAHLAFPCFDQPDLKARFRLTLDIPREWLAVSNGAERDATFREARKRIRFEPAGPLPTYLLAFAAGRFQMETARRAGRSFRMFHRETEAAKVARNRDSIFELHARALDWLEQYTGIPYPWGKFDFVLIPSFQFGGMEHAGAIFYNASSLLLDQSATQNQMLSRAAMIAHESAHLWFGDLVTMRWFNDVWMKEVLANFMAAKIVNPSFPQVNHELRFLVEYYPAAYRVDRTAGSNPIRQKLENLNQAGTLYGPIIYDKAPIVMRQLERTLGAERFRDSLREFLRRYAFQNATWLDWVGIMDRGGGTIAAFSRAWVESRGRPLISTSLRLTPDGHISRLALTQSDPLGRGLNWPQQFQVAIGWPDRRERLPASMSARETAVAGAQGLSRPLYVLPNGEGLGYGLFALDDGTLRFLLDRMEEIPDALTRGSAWIDIWENLLDARVAPTEFLRLAMRALPQESDQQNTQLVLGYLSHAFWHFLPPGERAAKAADIERLLRAGIARAGTSSEKSAWFHAFRDTALTREGLAWLGGLWRRERQIEGLPFAETDEIEMSAALALREVAGWREILTAQRDRTRNPDRKARFEFVMPSLDADAAVRERAFTALRDGRNRVREAWALEALGFLCHPLRERQARGFLRPGLELLPEIQRTGDIFFPARWADTLLGGQRSPAAASIVRDYLARERDLPERLRWIVLTAADELLRLRAAG